jgi:hypothetical protein
LGRHDRLYSANLLEAELRSAFAREGVGWSDVLVAPIGWVLPPRSLGPEMERVLNAGLLRGTDLWHVACALFLWEEIHSLTFLTLDERQRTAATEMGLDAPKI